MLFQRKSSTLGVTGEVPFKILVGVSEEIVPEWFKAWIHTVACYRDSLPEEAL